EIIIEVDSGRLLSCIRENNSSRPGPVYCSKAHGTRLAARINITTRQLVIIQLLTSLPDRNYFRVSCGIAGRSHPVVAFRDDLIVLHNHASKWPAFTLLHALSRDLYRP